MSAVFRPAYAPRFSSPEDKVRAAGVDPLTMFASDGVDIKPGSGHQRSAGPNLRVLGCYVRARAALSLVRALRTMRWVPAQRI